MEKIRVKLNTEKAYYLTREGEILDIEGNKVNVKPLKLTVGDVKVIDSYLTEKLKN